MKERVSTGLPKPYKDANESTTKGEGKKKELKLAVHYNKDIDETDSYACKDSHYNPRPISKTSFHSNHATQSHQSQEQMNQYYPTTYPKEADQKELKSSSKSLQALAEYNQRMLGLQPSESIKTH